MPLIFKKSLNRVEDINNAFDLREIPAMPIVTPLELPVFRLNIAYIPINVFQMTSVL